MKKTAAALKTKPEELPPLERELTGPELEVMREALSHMSGNAALLVLAKVAAVMAERG